MLVKNCDTPSLSEIFETILLTLILQSRNNSVLPQILLGSFMAYNDMCMLMKCVMYTYNVDFVTLVCMTEEIRLW